MRVMTNLLNLRQNLNFDGDVFEEVGLFNYLGTLITRKNKISEETMTENSCRCSMPLQFRGYF
jgi:hypothetical protein